ncbi:MAG: hypothetical protein ACE5J4_00365 [Candidatus Aenigmatarchaeota archaeon]
MAWQDVLITLWNNFLISLPALVTALIWLVIGFIVGRAVGMVVKEILIRIKLDQYVVEKEKLKVKLSDIFSVIAKWVIYLIFIQIAAEALGVATIIGFINSAITFLLGAIEAATLIIVGYSLAMYIKEKVVSSKTIYGDIIGNVIFFLIVYISIALALPFVGIDPTLINWILLVIIASIGLGLAIAIGLGLKDVVAESAKKYARKFKR